MVKRLIMAAVALALVVGVVIGGVVGNPFVSAEPAAPNPGHTWTELEGHGTSGGDYWLGTTVDQALELHVNAERALRLEPVPGAPNLIGGYGGNTVTPGVGSATICGGGALDDGLGNPAPNRVTDNAGTVGGGSNNQAGDDAGTTSDAWLATVGGGGANIASGETSTVAGGGANTASGDGATIGGGGWNTASGYGATIGGGGYNVASGAGATIAGGAQQLASGEAAAISGGGHNEASGFGATVGGGGYNVASAAGATISGGGGEEPGQGNRVTGDGGTVGGGAGNVASAAVATIGGGYNNNAGGNYATVPGGFINSAAGEYSFAAGKKARANNAGCFIWGDSGIDPQYVDCDANNQFKVYSSGGIYLYTSRDGSTGQYLVGGSSSWSTPSSRALKENFAELDGQEVLVSLAEVPINTWNYKAQDDGIRHAGAVAEDFYAAFGLGESDTAISTVDADGVALAAIQGLYELSQEKDAEIADLSERLAEVEQAGGVGSASPQGSSSGLSAAWLVVAGLLGGLALVVVGLVLARRRLPGGTR